jgi:hypothetical protein
METQLMDALLAKLVNRRTLIEVVTSECNCKVERVHIGNSGLILLRKDPKKLGVTHVGFQLIGVHQLAHMCDDRDKPSTIGSALEILANLHPIAAPAVVDIALPIAMETGADVAYI